LILAPCSTTTAPIHATSTVVAAALNFIDLLGSLG
jgi:hypothetical protein